jgi:glycosyltransferase involved in cell wall biosynthesis
MTGNNANNPLISVIVPVFNCAEYLPDCIDSIREQTYGNLEILLVDDGSKDNSGEICDRYARLDGRITAVHQENAGVSAARNSALDIAAGDYIGFVDADDTIEPDMFSSLMQNLTENDCDISICAFNMCENGVKPDVQAAGYSSCEVHGAEEAMRNMLVGRHYAGHVCNKLFKAEMLRELRFDSSIKIYEDLLFTVQVLINCKQISFTEKPLYNYMLRRQSAFHQVFSETKYTAHYACEQIIELVRKRNSALLSYAYASDIICNLTMISDLHSGGSREQKKHYYPLIRENLRRHVTQSSLNALMFRSQRLFALLGEIHPSLTCLAANLVRLIKR